MSQETAMAEMDRCRERGRIEERIPPGIERRAIEIFEERSKMITGHVWDWEKAGDEVRNRFRLTAFVEKYKDPLDPEVKAAVDAAGRLGR